MSSFVRAWQNIITCRVALVLMFFIIFFILSAASKKNTGTIPSFDDMGKVSLGIIPIIGLIAQFIILLKVVMFT